MAGYFLGISIFLAILAITLWRCLPTYKSETNLNYFQLLGSIFKLFATTPVFRSFVGFCFLSFGLLWTSMAFLLASDLLIILTLVIGLFGLVGAAGALMAGKTGVLDKGKAESHRRINHPLSFLGFYHCAPYYHWIGLIQLYWRCPAKLSCSECSCH